MARYHVRFVKTLSNDTGHQHRCVEGVIDIGHARDPERALQAAKRRFERHEENSALGFACGYG